MAEASRHRDQGRRSTDGRRRLALSTIVLVILMAMAGWISLLAIVAFKDVKDVLDKQDEANSALRVQAVQNEITGLRTQEGTSCVTKYISDILAANSREEVRGVKPCELADLDQIRKDLRQAEQKLAEAQRLQLQAKEE